MTLSTISTCNGKYLPRKKHIQLFKECARYKISNATDTTMPRKLCITYSAPAQIIDCLLSEAKYCQI
jgi:hypothetical protein